MPTPLLKTLSYELHERQADEPRPGRLSLLIEGVDSEWSVDPSQWMPLGLEAALAAGKPAGPEAAAFAQEYCLQRAAKAVERRAARLNAGRPLGHGVNELRDMQHAYGKETTERWMNRGTLKGLDKAQRRARMLKRAQKFDNERDWAERRAKLIAECQEELDRWLAEPEHPKAQRMVAILRDRLRGLQPKVVAVIHGFQYAYTQYWTAAVNLSTDDIRLWPYMTNTTIDTVRDAVDTFSDVTLDEFDGSNYSSGGLALDSQTVAVDDANDRAEFDCTDEVVSALGAGTRAMQGVSVGKFNTNTAGSLPLHAIDFTTNKNPDGSDFTFAINAEGLMQMADG